MRRLPRQGSLGRRVFVALIVGELAFAAVLGVTIGVFTTLSDVRQREVAVRQISSTIAAALMPMIADQQIDHVQGAAHEHSRYCRRPRRNRHRHTRRFGRRDRPSR